jgi:hypothetical protein
VQQPWGMADFSVGPSKRHHFVSLAMLRADWRDCTNRSR